MSSAGRRNVALLALVAQTTSLIITLRYSRAREVDTMYLSTSAVATMEFIKIAVCVSYILFRDGIGRGLALVYHSVVVEYVETLKCLVPAVVYTIQNNLLYVALSNLDAPFYQVTYQLKMVTTVLFSKVLLGRTYSRNKWIAVFILVAGVAIVQLSDTSSSTPPAPAPAPADVDGSEAVGSAESTADGSVDAEQMVKAAGDAREGAAEAAAEADAPIETSKDNHQNTFLGLTCVLAACCTSGFAGVFNELVLKGREDAAEQKPKPPLEIFNIRLALFGMSSAIVTMFAKDAAAVYEGGVFQGFDSVVWFIVWNQALGGLLVAIVIKWASNVVKNFAFAISVVASTLISAFLFGYQISLMFGVGAALVVGATFLYSQPDPIDPLKRGVSPRARV